MGIDEGGGNGLNATSITNATNILFENVRCDVGTTSSYDLSGLNGSFPITNVRFRECDDGQQRDSRGADEGG